MVWNSAVELDPGDEPALSRRAWLSHRKASQYQVSPETSLAEQVAAQIEAMAREEEPGARLGSKDELRELVGVSVGTLNEALRIAQARGAVTLRRGPGGGIFSAHTTSLMRLGAQIVGMETSTHTLRDALRMRNALDPLALSDAVEHVSRFDIDDLRGILEGMQRAAESGDVDGFIRGHWNFQSRVTSISPNALLRTVFVGLIEFLDEHAVAVMPLGRDGQEGLRLQLDLHERMIAALEARDREAAFGVMRDYVASQGETLHGW
ncbi:MAG: FadR family transcriptional regulator [Candidatus Leucobacter sulfamidivorax]|nr:FadR family transcriptional regulator [Candidatus Leucobacter sulfamidivorax]